MSRFAEGTTVPVEKTKMEIERMLTRCGASHYGVMHAPDLAHVAFQVRDRKVRFDLVLPAANDSRFRNGRRSPIDQLSAEVRRRWRALAMVIKAKLEAVESGITTFEEEFLAHLVMENGLTVGQAILPRLSEAVASGRLLPPAGDAA